MMAESMLGARLLQSLGFVGRVMRIDVKHKISVLAIWFLLDQFSAAVPQGHATPIPETKPLFDLNGIGFVEGVDVPSAKPQPEKAVPKQKNQQTAISENSCIIPNAEFEELEPVSGAIREGQLNDIACGISDPVRLESVSAVGHKIEFSSPVTVSCKFAKVVAEWLREDVLPLALNNLETSVSVIQSGPGYQCRRRNNLPDGKLSEHALGKALDISHFKLGNGTIISVEDDWGKRTKESKFLDRIHAAACKRFTTVLGPEADPNHKSHIHLDTGCHGQDCTYIICQ